MSLNFQKKTQVTTQDKLRVILAVTAAAALKKKGRLTEQTLATMLKQTKARSVN